MEGGGHEGRPSTCFSPGRAGNLLCLDRNLRFRHRDRHLSNRWREDVGSACPDGDNTGDGRIDANRHGHRHRSAHRDEHAEAHSHPNAARREGLRARPCGHAVAGRRSYPERPRIPVVPHGADKERLFRSGRSTSSRRRRGRCSTSQRTEVGPWSRSTGSHRDPSRLRNRGLPKPSQGHVDKSCAKESASTMWAIGARTTGFGIRTARSAEDIAGGQATTDTALASALEDLRRQPVIGAAMGGACRPQSAGGTWPGGASSTRHTLLARSM